MQWGRALVISSCVVVGACSGTTRVEGGADSCAVTNDHATLSVVSNGIDELDCSRLAEPTDRAMLFTHVGTARSVTATSFELECTEGDCAAERVAIRFEAPGLDATRSLTEGASVRVTASLNYFFACVTGIAVETNAPAGDAGTSAEPGLLFSVGEGARPPTNIVTVSFDKIDCSYPWKSKSCGGVGDDEVGIYAMTARAPFLAHPLTVRMGRTAQSAISGSARVFRERNLRSYQTDGCDDYWNWAGWVAIEGGR